MEKVKSSDGTLIAYHCKGTGTPLVLVAGMGAANPMTWPVVPVLVEHFRVCAVDRRGRGESGDGSSYALEREFEDIVAVLDSIGEPAFLLGHSFAALLALESALLIGDLRRLILYEPLIPRLDVPAYPDGHVDRLEAQLKAGDREGALIVHLRQDAGLTADEIGKLMASPAWPARLATVDTLPREKRSKERYKFDAQRFKDLRTPTLILVGGESSPDFKESAETVHKVLPNSQIAILPGQRHVAMYAAPELFIKAVLPFLSD